MDLVKLVTDKINVEETVDSVGCESCGATSVFVGTTRDNFENKKVVRLEYEAYEPMAINEMNKICKAVRDKWQVRHIAFVHRLGLVPVKEASIVVAISSPHRKESLEAVQFTIDALKTSVPIWKKEVYDNENESKWKSNPECAWKENNKHASESCS
ncbi:unnamed protein product [Allacma fusca]|uniref:Molybdopterin synthase catalytic subunit n=1 Tax=Allacma fusca TaxID=39272 RepID=A0A8J2LQZ2_9HEXA|nr:unnamed protein product [Allacma fusca]